MKREVWLVLAVILMISQTVLPKTTASATSNSIWTGTDQVTITDEGEAPVEQTSQLNCSVSSKVGTRLKNSTRDLAGNLNLSEANKIFSTVSAQCYYQNKLGLFTKSGNLWAMPGSDRAVRIYANPTTATVPVPGDSTTLIMSTPSAVSGKNFSINHNLTAIGRLDTDGSPKELIWRLSSMSDYIKYSNGSLVNFDSADFSSNGRYMVALLAQKVLVRVDMKNRELTPIGPANYSSGTTPSYAISNDGNYVLSSAAGLKFFDLSACQNKYAEGQWPSNITPSSTFPGCTSRDVFAQSKTVLPFYEKVGQMRFSPDGRIARAEVNWRDAAGILHWHRLKLVSAGYALPQGYLAMGDSFASGEGDTEGGTYYEPGTDEHEGNGRNLCHLSRRSYPYLVANATGYLVSTSATPPIDGIFHSVACSGAKMNDILSSNQYDWLKKEPLKGWLPGYIRQVEYTSEDQDKERGLLHPSIVTMSIGGNDVGFVDNLLPCLKPGTCELAQADSTKRGNLVKEMAALKPRLTETYKEVKKAADGARVYVLGYPQIVQEAGGTCAVNVLLNSDERVFVGRATSYFNQVIQSAANEAGVLYVNAEDVLNGVNLCSGVPDSEVAVNGVTAGNDRPLGKLTFMGNVFGSESYHPNHKAQPRYRDRLLAATNNLTRPMPVAVIAPTPTPDAYFGFDAQNFVANQNNPSLPNTVAATRQNIITGITDSGQAAIWLSGLQPNTTVSLEMHSTPTSLGSYISSVNGELNVTVTVPNTVEPGFHEIHAKAIGLLGEPVEYYEPIIVLGDESDIDNDGLANSADPCLFVEASAQDVDQDGVDDACDGDLSTPLTVQEPDPVPGTELTTEFEDKTPSPEEPEFDFGHEPNPAKPEVTLALAEQPNTETSQQAIVNSSSSEPTAQSPSEATQQSQEPQVFAEQTTNPKQVIKAESSDKGPDSGKLLWYILAGLFVFVVGVLLITGKKKPI